jgi:hypothetical protein
VYVDDDPINSTDGDGEMNDYFKCLNDCWNTGSAAIKTCKDGYEQEYINGKKNADYRNADKAIDCQVAAIDASKKCRIKCRKDLPVASCP